MYLSESAPTFDFKWSSFNGLSMDQFVFHTTRVSPERALFGAWACWFVCFLLMPISVVFYGTFKTVTLFIAANAALWFGLSFSRFSKSYHRIPARRLAFDARNIRVILLCLIVAGAVAIAAKMVDLTVYRGILHATSFADARLKMEVNGSNLFSGLYFGLSPAILAAGVVAVVLFQRGRYNWMVVAALILFSINPLFSFVYGGRSVLFLAAGLAVITWLLTVPTVSRRQMLYVLGLVLAVFVVTMYLFVSRAVENVGVQVDRLATMSGYTKLVPLGAGTIATMRDLPELGRYVLYYVTSVGQYVLHGVFEFFYLVQAKGSDQSLLWGKYQFTLYDQLQRAILGSGFVPDLEAYNPTSGLFSTFWGPAYIDFGYLMVVYGFVFGYFTGRVRELVGRGDLFALPLYVLLVFQLFLVPIVNGILLASSVILNVGFLVIWLLTRWYLRRRVALAKVAA
jgi:oligosaccharide repeat unit polymerase